MDNCKDFCHELLTFFRESRFTEASERVLSGQKVPVYENEFWTSKQRDAHSLHELSYRACYKPQLPGFFIERFCRPGDRVYDPFMGRGTTLIEARLRGCQPIGNDANPLSEVLAGPRLNPPQAAEVAERLEAVGLRGESEPGDPELLTFFSPETLAELDAWRSYFREGKSTGRFDRIDAWIQMVASNRLTGHSKGFFSVYTLPPNQAASVASQRRINEKRQQKPEYRNTRELILKKTKQLLRHPLPAGYAFPEAKLLCESADSTPAIPSDSVRLVVTSPPFLDTVDYLGDNWMRMWFCEKTIRPDRIWQIKSLEDWVARMVSVFEELRRILEPGGWLAFEVGEIRKGTLLLENEVAEAGRSAGLAPVCIMINSQNFTKTANCWGVSNNSKGTNSNRIVVFRKES